MEFDAVHGHGHQNRRRTTGFRDLPVSPDGTRLVEVAEDDAAEDCSMGIGIARHHHNLDGKIRLGHGAFPVKSSFPWNSLLSIVMTKNQTRLAASPPRGRWATPPPEAPPSNKELLISPVLLPPASFARFDPSPERTLP